MPTQQRAKNGLKIGQNEETGKRKKAIGNSKRKEKQKTVRAGRTGLRTLRRRCARRPRTRRDKDRPGEGKSDAVDHKKGGGGAAQKGLSESRLSHSVLAGPFCAPN